MLFYARIIDMKRLSRIMLGLLAVFMAFSPSTAFAIEHIELDDDRLGAVSQNCASTKVRLQRIQKDDARNRIHLGAQYESIATKLMLNLNLRLVKNNLADADIAEQQTTFASERERFKKDYIGYSQEFENLLKINCKTNTADFYYQLEIVRAKRNDVYYSMGRLREIITNHRESVVNLRESL